MAKFTNHFNLLQHPSKFVIFYEKATTPTPALLLNFQLYWSNVINLYEKENLGVQDQKHKNIMWKTMCVLKTWRFEMFLIRIIRSEVKRCFTLSSFFTVTYSKSSKIIQASLYRTETHIYLVHDNPIIIIDPFPKV